MTVRVRVDAQRLLGVVGAVQPQHSPEREDAGVHGVQLGFITYDEASEETDVSITE